MAGEWLKFESNLPEKPETLAISAAMGWDDPDLAVGKLMRVFRWFDQQTIDGNARGVTPALLDRVIGVTGLVQAIADAGWITVTEGGLCLNGFEKHNGASAKSRAQTAKRVANFRAERIEDQPLSSSNAATVTPALAREEKRREEKKKTPKSPKDLPAGFARFWATWPKHERKEAQGKCLEAWVRDGAEPYAERIVAHVERLKVSSGWTKNGGEFIPAPLVYLHQRKWEGVDLEDSGWWKVAGFGDKFEAENAGCRQSNVAQFRDGKRIEEPA